MTTDPRVAAAVENNLRDKDPKMRVVFAAAQGMLREAVPDLVETVNPWGYPTFESNGPFAYLSASKNHVSLVFLWATSLDDPTKLLEGTGKNLRHIKLRTVEDVKREGMRELVEAAVRLNATEPQTGMPGRRRDD